MRTVTIFTKIFSAIFAVKIFCISLFDKNNISIFYCFFDMLIIQMNLRQIFISYTFEDIGRVAKLGFFIIHFGFILFIKNEMSSIVHKTDIIRIPNFVIIFPSPILCGKFCIVRIFCRNIFTGVISNHAFKSFISNCAAGLDWLYNICFNYFMFIFVCYKNFNIFFRFHDISLENYIFINFMAFIPSSNAWCVHMYSHLPKRPMLSIPIVFRYFNTTSRFL